MLNVFCNFCKLNIIYILHVFSVTILQFVAQLPQTNNISYKQFNQFNSNAAASVDLYRLRKGTTSVANHV